MDGTALIHYTLPLFGGSSGEDPGADLDTKYTGMFWTQDGKVDKATILKFVLLNQHERQTRSA